MSLLNKIGILMFIVVSVLFFLFARQRNQGIDSSGPKMSIEQEILEVSVNDSEEKLLEGITAWDKKDGDVTDSVVLESLSAFISGSTRLATYAAFDSDQHVVRESRRITYTDYTKPEFSMRQLLEYPAGRSSISINHPSRFRWAPLMVWMKWENMIRFFPLLTVPGTWLLSMHLLSYMILK